MVGAVAGAGKAGRRHDRFAQGQNGADQGTGDVINFFEYIDARKRPRKVVVQVKSGKVNSDDIPDLKGTTEREKTAIGVFITLE